MTHFRMGEFFSGPGGMALGASVAAGAVSTDDHKLALEHVWANDYHSDTAQTYKRNINIQPAGFLEGDVNDVEIPALPSIDGFAFGFPCNDFSTVGENRGLDGEFGPLYLKGIEVLKEKQPAWFVAENVTGLQSANGGSALSEILAAMAFAGYNLVPHVYSFDKYGVPQRRRRIIIVGIRSDIDVRFEVPAPETNAPQSVRAALSDIPEGAPNHETPRQTGRVRERLTLIAPGENAFNAAKLKEPQNAHLRLNVKGATLSNIYRRLEADKPSYTVTGSGGGGTHMYHWDEPRALTNRERARLQSFPDDFVFHGGPESVRRQIGMAVPVNGAKAVFEALFRTLLGIQYPRVDPSMPRIYAPRGSLAPT